MSKVMFKNIFDQWRNGENITNICSEYKQNKEIVYEILLHQCIAELKSRGWTEKDHYALDPNI